MAVFDILRRPHVAERATDGEEGVEEEEQYDRQGDEDGEVKEA